MDTNPHNKTENAGEINYRSKNSNLYLSIYNYVKDMGRLPSPEKSGLTKQNLNYYVRSLKKGGFIRKKGYGTWEITDKEFEGKKVGKVPNNRAVNLAKNIRAHSFLFSLQFKSFHNWDKRVSYLKKNNIDFKLVYGCNPSIDFDSFTMHLNSNSLVLYLKEGVSVIEKTAKDGHLALIDMGIVAVKKLESLLNFSFATRGKYKLNLLKQEYGNINNELAKSYNVSEDKLAVYGEDGKQWLLIDNSFSLAELETVHPVTADKDMDECIVPFFNSIKNKKGFTADFINDSFMKSNENITALSKTVEKVIQAQVSSSSGLNEAIAKISEVVVQTIGGMNNLAQQNANLISEVELLTKDVQVLAKSVQFLATRETLKDDGSKQDPIPYVG